MKPEAIIFDLSEVYLRGLKGTHERVAAHLGSPLEDGDMFNDALARLFHGEVTERAYWEALIAERGWDVRPEELERIVRSNFGPIGGTEEIVIALKAHGYRLGLLSVHAKEWIAYCEEAFHYREHFDVVAYSYEDGVSKPDPRAFERMLERMGVTANQTLFIDDAEANIATAAKLGMATIQFVSAGHLRVELVRRGMLPS